MTTRRSRALALVLAVTLAACQDGLVDVGTIQEDELDDPANFPALVNGMSRALSAGFGLVQQIGMFVALEARPGGNQGDYGATLSQAAGRLDPVENDPHWNELHRARWTAEDGVRRMRRVLGDEAFDSSPLAAEALVYVGFANRTLGENMCQAVIDGGPAEPRSVHFERALAAFEEAIAIAERAGEDVLADAARGGRASVLADLGRWSEARTAAAFAEPGFSFAAKYHDTGVDQYNRIAWGSSTQLRTNTAYGTIFEPYLDEIDDPRVPLRTVPDFPTTGSGEPWIVQDKYPNRNSPVPLVDWAEMRLIVAESHLLDGQIGPAMDELHALRDAAGVERWEATTLEEAWTALKFERGLETWLEGRRMWDLGRWLEEGTPGEAPQDMTGRDTCFPIGATEMGTNPNLR